MSFLNSFDSNTPVGEFFKIHILSKKPCFLPFTIDEIGKWKSHGDVFYKHGFESSRNPRGKKNDISTHPEKKKHDFSMSFLNSLDSNIPKKPQFVLSLRPFVWHNFPSSF